MFGHEAVAYECCRNSMEKYRQDEGLPTKGFPRLVSPDDEVVGGLQQMARALRRALASRKLSGQQLHIAEQRTFAK